ncbi:hypothetical protein R6242_11210 [Iodobacter sp. CM08]|uniref:hypothetical protein n=1 Tax=Iodobacter sp. CM08 TaxID=3085902 RepID=UPI00298263BC|nr:hypothetical protein [Iodobacter sp. CM08]MDW5417133.1 hypothetical protein [Iodobacter sp. CM08]
MDNSLISLYISFIFLLLSFFMGKVRSKFHRSISDEKNIIILNGIKFHRNCGVFFCVAAVIFYKDGSFRFGFFIDNFYLFFLLALLVFIRIKILIDECKKDESK